MAEVAEERTFQPGDRLIDCLGCGVTFLFTAGEWDYYKDKNLKPPKRCGPCRRTRREDRERRGEAEE